MNERQKLILASLAGTFLFDVVSVLFGSDGLGAQACLLISFVVAWACEKEQS